MTDQSHLKHSDQINPQKHTSPKEHADRGQAETVADGEQGLKHGDPNPRKAALSKREIMEELSRARFPWEE